jgi:hypothetical protein
MDDEATSEILIVEGRTVDTAETVERPPPAQERFSSIKTTGNPAAFYLFIRRPPASQASVGTPDLRALLYKYVSLGLISLAGFV